MIFRRLRGGSASSAASAWSDAAVSASGTPESGDRRVIGPTVDRDQRPQRAEPAAALGLGDDRHPGAKSARWHKMICGGRLSWGRDRMLSPIISYPQPPTPARVGLSFALM